MKLKSFFLFLTSHRKYLLLSSLVTIVALTVLSLNFSKIVLASFATWGDSSLVHACYDQRGRVTIIDSSEECNANETEATWIKDVDAGTGLSISRSSSGATISLANDNSSGWYGAGESWTYAAADSPSFTFTISGDKTGKYSPGMRVKLTQTTVKYFIITKVEYSNPNTTVTVYGGTDYTLANASITDPYFSTQKAPQGFPLNPAKWTVEVVYNSNGNQGSPTQNVWYNIGSASIEVPIGSWELSYTGDYGFDSASEGNYNAYITLSTSNNGESDVNFTNHVSQSYVGVVFTHASKERYINLSSKTTYYLNVKTGVSGLNFIYSGSSDAPTIIKAVSSYL